MKILQASQIKKLDQYTIQEEDISSAELMERASFKVSEWLFSRFNKDRPFYFFCGPGNNGGDGLAIARIMLNAGYSVNVFKLLADNYSLDCITNLHRVEKLLTVKTLDYSTLQKIEIPSDSVIIDAIFGSGLNRKAEGIYAEIIEKINQSEGKIVAIDIPSGLSADGLSFDGPAINAAITLSFQLPKLAFFLSGNARNIGNWYLLDIGLSEDFLHRCNTNYFYTVLEDLLPLIKDRPRFSHKGTFGKALIVAGNYGSIGAAVLATEACYRSGAGLITAYTPGCGYSIIQSTVPEALCLTDPEMHHISMIPDPEGYNAIGIGPGISEGKETEKALLQFLKICKEPIVLDASALNILSRQNNYQELIPENSILTPHPKEFERLVGPWKSDMERLELQKRFAKSSRSFLVLKGAYTSITSPSGDIYFNSTGNAGMATGGSGDVLTGLITGLLAQGYEPQTAAVLGVFIHGYAGDKAAAEGSQEAMKAGDINKHLGDFYLYIEKLRGEIR